MCTPRQCTTRWQVGVGVGVGVVAPSRAGRTVSPSLWTAVVRLVPRVVEVNGRTFCAYVRFLVHLGHLGYHHRRRACAHLRHGSTWCHPTAVPRGSCGGRPLGSLPPATNQEHDRPQRQQLQSGPSTGAEQGVRSTGGESTALSSRSKNGGGIGVEERVERRSALAAGKNKDTTAKARRKRARLSVSLYTRASATRHPAKAARTPPTHRRTADGHAQTPTRAARPQMSDSGRPQDPTVRAPSEAVPQGRWPWWTGTPQPTAQHPPVAPALTTLACQHHTAHPARRPRHASGTGRATRQPNQPPPATTVIC